MCCGGGAVGVLVFVCACGVFVCVMCVCRLCLILVHMCV